MVRWRGERGQCRGMLLMSWILVVEVLEGRVESWFVEPLDLSSNAW